MVGVWLTIVGETPPQVEPGFETNGLGYRKVPSRSGTTNHGSGVRNKKLEHTIAGMGQAQPLGRGPPPTPHSVPSSKVSPEPPSLGVPQGVLEGVHPASQGTFPSRSRLRLEPEDVPVGGYEPGLQLGGPPSLERHFFPVQTQGSTVPTTPLWSNFMAQPLLFELMKTARPPKFSGRPSDWVNFVAAWEKYWAKISAGQTSDEETKMQIFEECLDSTSVLDVDSRRRRGELVTFARYFTYLDSRFGKSRQSQVRQALAKLELHKDGKQVTLEAWRTFSVQFQNLVQEAGMSEEDGYEKLNEKIGGLRNWIIDKELKEEKKAPTVELTFPTPMSREEILGFLQEYVGASPKSLTTLSPTKCKVTYEDKRHAGKVVALNERKVEGSQGRKIRASAVEARVTLWEAINFIQEKLEAEDRKQLKRGYPEYQRRAYAVEGESRNAEVQAVKLNPVEEQRGRDPHPRDTPPRREPSTHSRGSNPPRDSSAPRSPPRGGGTYPWGERSQGRLFPTPPRNSWRGSRMHTNSLDYECLYGAGCRDPLCHRWHPQLDHRWSSSKGKGDASWWDGKGGKGGKGEGKGKGEGTGKGKGKGDGKGKGEGKGFGGRPPTPVASNLSSPPSPSGGGKGGQAPAVAPGPQA